MSQTSLNPATGLSRTSSTQLNYNEKGLGVPGVSSSKTKPQTVDFSALTRPEESDDEVSKSNENSPRNSLPISSPPTSDGLDPLDELTEMTVLPKTEPEEAKLSKKSLEDSNSSSDIKPNETAKK